MGLGETLVELDSSDDDDNRETGDMNEMEESKVFGDLPKLEDIIEKTLSQKLHDKRLDIFNE
jgi:hypothetical protein